jgi:hypothetical protein
MYILGFAVVVFVTAQSLFFLRKAWKRGRELGLSQAQLRGTVSASVLFTIAPSIAVAATVLALSKALGIVLPWIRLSVIGNLSYETTAAQAAANALRLPGGIAVPITDPKAFSAIAWVMTIGSVFPLVLLPLLLKKIQKKIGGAASGKAKWADLMSAAAFLGLIAAFVSRAVAGSGAQGIRGDGAGVLSIITLLAAVGFLLLLEWLARRLRWQWAAPFAMPLSMFLAMGVAVLFARVLLPEHIAFYEWRG